MLRKVNITNDNISTKSTVEQAALITASIKSHMVKARNSDVHNISIAASTNRTVEKARINDLQSKMDYHIKK